MIKLTELCGVKGDCENPIWIPADVVVRDDGTGLAQLKIPNVPGWTTVTESPDEVTRKILEYKLAMVRYAHHARETEKYPNANHSGNATEQQKRMFRLAGMEE